MKELDNIKKLTQQIREKVLQSPTNPITDKPVTITPPEKPVDTSIDKVYTSWIYLEKKFTGVREISIGLKDRGITVPFDTTTDVLEDKILQELIVPIVKDRLKLNFERVIVASGHFSVKGKEVNMTVFIAFINPKFAITKLPRFRVDVKETSNRIKKFVPSYWKDFLFAADTLPFNLCNSITVAMSNVEGFHFVNANYTEKECIKIAENLLTKKPGRYAIWTNTNLPEQWKTKFNSWNRLIK